MIVFFDDGLGVPDRGTVRARLTIVPQLLSDGVKGLENVIVLGTPSTPAILRPGRLDVKIEIGGRGAEAARTSSPVPDPELPFIPNLAEVRRRPAGTTSRR